MKVAATPDRVFTFTHSADLWYTPAGYMVDGTWSTLVDAAGASGLEEAAR